MKMKLLQVGLAAMLITIAGGLMSGCGDDDDNATVAVPPVFISAYDEVFDWACDTGETCQDVYNIEFAAGAVVDIGAIEVTGGSTLQMALYAPGESLGGLNILTGTTAELRCNFVQGCLNNTGGQSVTGLVIGDAGVYRLAITRDWDTSCGTTGDYRLMISGDLEFSTPVLTRQNVESVATGVSCP